MGPKESSLQDPTVAHRLFQFITSMSDDERRTLLKLLEEGLLKGKCRRQYARVARQVPVTHANERQTYRDFIRDISLGGVFMLTSVPFKVGDEIILVFNSGDRGNPVRMLGKVARVTPEGVGVRFTSLSNDKKAAILSLASEARDSGHSG